MVKKSFLLGFLFTLLTILLAAESDCPQYTLTMKVKPEKGKIEAKVKIQIPWTAQRQKQGSVCIATFLNAMEAENPNVFPLINDKGSPEGFSPANAFIYKASVNREPVSVLYAKTKKKFLYTYNTEHLIHEIKLAQNPEIGASIEIEFDYFVQLSHSQSMDDFYGDEQMVSRFFWFPYLLPADYSLDKPGLSLSFFTFQAEAQCTQGWDMAALGTDFAKDNGNRYTVFSAKPVNSFPLCFVRGRSVYKTQMDNKILQVYHTKDQEGMARQIASYAADAIRYFEKTYFPLDYKYISILQSLPGAYGMGSDSCILLGDGLFSGAHRIVPDLFNPAIDYIVSHEVGHFFFGISSAQDFTRENYLSEGINEYATLKYIDAKYGPWTNMLNNNSKDPMSWVIKWLMYLNGYTSWRAKKIVQTQWAYRSGWQRPLTEEPEEKISNTLAVTDYDKTFFVVSMLAKTAGEQKFCEALQFYLTQQRYRATSTSDFKSAIERFYSQNLDAFFSRYVYKTESIDYGIEGKLNIRNAEGKFQSEVVISRLDKNESFFPVNLTAMLENGKTAVFPVLSDGAITIDTESPIRYAMLDKDADLLDYNRKNNCWPRQFTLDLTQEQWLLYDASVLWTLSLYADSDNLGLYAGTGLSVYEKSSYFYDLGAYTCQTNNLGIANFGAYLNSAWKLHPYALLNSTLRMAQNGILDLARLRYTQSFYLPLSVGSVQKTFLPVFHLSAEASISSMPWNTLAPEIYNTKASLLLDSTVLTGTMASLSNTAQWNKSFRFEDSLNLELAQGIRILPRTLLAFKLSAGGSFNELSALAQTNKVLGNTPDIQYGSFGLGLKSFIGVPLINGCSIPLANWLVFQSLNLGFCYEIRSAGFEPDGFWKNFQHAVGLEFFPVFRTLMPEVPLGFGFGLSWNLTNLADETKRPAQWYIPSFFIETDLLAQLFGVCASY